MSAEKKRLLTGDRPTGKLHLGHYVGSLKNRVALQSSYESFVMIADVQALTDNFDHPEKVRANVLEVAMDNLAVGVDPSLTTFFIQSQISEIAELTVYYSNLVTVSELQRNPTVKDELASKGHIFKDGLITFGFLGYPVSQAADITFARAHAVPVGEDQKPMIEQTRRIVKKFNEYYGEIFPLPEAVISDCPRLAGLDGRKMSKSLDNAIYLSDSEDEVKEKIKRAKTDLQNTITFDPEKRPEVSNLLTYYQIATGESMDTIVEKFADVTSYKVFKEELARALNGFLEPIRERRRAYEARPDHVMDILREGQRRAKQEAEKTMALVRSGMKIDYV